MNLTHDDLDSRISKAYLDGNELVRLALIELRELSWSRKPKPLYAVFAYRWGWTNAHHYLVTITDDKETAIEKATEERDSRGGKYGVAVFDTDGNQVYHAPSSYAEKASFTNYRIETFSSVGGYFICEWEHGREADLTEAKRRWEQGKMIERIWSEQRAKALLGDGAQKTWFGKPITETPYKEKE